jgi:hypothetical protein
MYRLGLVALMAAVSAFLPGQALADLTNGSFEEGTGSLTGWTWTVTGGSGGLASVVSSYTSATGSPAMSWSPTNGSWFALLTPPTGNQETELYQSFTAPATDSTLGFNFFWDREANGSDQQNDSARARILNGTGTSGAQVGSDLFAFNRTNADTAWGSFSKSIQDLGLTQGNTYTLLFEMINVGQSYTSHLGIDNVALTTTTPVSSDSPAPTHAPLPASFLLGVLGLSAAGLKLRRSV